MLCLRCHTLSIETRERQDAFRASAGNANPRQRCREGQDHGGRPPHTSYTGQDAQRQAPTSFPRRPPRRPEPNSALAYAKLVAFNDAIPQQFTIQEAKLATDANGFTKGFAFVTFNCPDAAVYVRQITMVLDGKPCLIVPYRSREDVGKQALSAGCGPDSGRVDLRARVNEFVNRYELPKDLRELFTKCKAECAARAVSKLEGRALDGQTPAKIAEIVKAELIDAKRHELPQCVQLKADRKTVSRIVRMLIRSLWCEVAKLSIDPTSKRQVMDYFHDRSAEEVDYVVDEEGDYFERGLPRQRDPVQWLSGEVRKHMQRKVQKLTDDFCHKFRLDEDVVDRLNKLNEIGQRNVMKKWECAGNRWDVEQRLRALLDDEERYKHRQQSKPWPSKGTVADKKKIEEDSSSSEDEKDITTKNGMADKLVLETIRKTAKQSSKIPDSTVKARSSNEVAFVRSQDWLRKSRQEKRIQEYEACSYFKLPVMGTRPWTTKASRDVSLSVECNFWHLAAQGRGDKRRKKPRPTHYIICVDASGSMMLDDCSSATGETVTRLDAVMEQMLGGYEPLCRCRSFMKESSLNSCWDEAFRLPMQEAQVRLRNSKPKAEKQTLYSQGLEGVRRAIKQESSGKPALVIFFSDGEPTDDGAFMQVLNKIKNKFDSWGPRGSPWSKP
eukprot:s7892_g1.t1